MRKGQIPRKAHGLVVFRIAEGPTCDFQAARRTSLKCGNVSVESSPVRGLFSSRQQLPGSRKCPPYTPHYTHTKREEWAALTSKWAQRTRRAFLKQQVIGLLSVSQAGIEYFIPLNLGWGPGQGLAPLLPCVIFWDLRR